MRLVDFRIRNFKSFGDTGTHSLAQSRNLVVGENSGGKTALLTALSMNFGNHPHRSRGMRADKPLPPTSEVDFSFAVSGSEIEDWVFQNGQPIYVPMRPSGPASAPSFEDIWVDVATSGQVTFNVTRQGGGGFGAERYPAFDLFVHAEPYPRHQTVVVPRVQEGRLEIGGPAQNQEEFGLVLARLTPKHIYLFNAERLAVAECAVGVSNVLRPDASNLAEVLHNLQDIQPRFARFVKLVSRVLPDVHHISVRNAPNNRVEIFISRYEDDRRELFDSLKDCGTGIGQTLAILYVAFSEGDQPKTILIDEPNSFLHPGASRRLIEVIKEYDRNQFIVSTHSPEVISAFDAEKLFLAKWGDDQSELIVVEGDGLRKVKAALAEVGTRLSDVYGADRIFWVEGPTEALCVPLLLQKGLGRSTSGMAILGVPDTGSFFSRRKELVLEIYQKLSESSALIPPVIAFLFDRELLTDAEIQDLAKRSNGLVNFLSRRTYENFPLNADAIAACLNAQDSSAPMVSVSQVIDWLAAHCMEPKYYKGIRSNEQIGWLTHVDAPRLLSDAFWQLRLVAYDKPRHGYALTESLLDQNSGDLRQLTQEVRAAIGLDAANV